ncbi:hypothetical protein M193_gp033 [Halorubrum tailed phage 7]|uniref:hypothetical protein n=1 Tax=Halorubrum tailed phage 7 TaxID=2847108 RepID=UPI000334825E|nr:hypothetical protein M193_gp033 [Halorubrum tailed phage 7]AGM10905.1 hypothetical protein HRTV7_33 [Halorubrum tailed phage 7]
MAINYGSGELGEVTITSNTTLKPISNYKSLTIQSGVTATIPSGSIIRSQEPMTINGTINVERRVGSGGGNGGDGGGSCIIFAPEINGSGQINAFGQNGGGGNNNSNSENNNQNYYTPGTPPQISSATSNVITTGASGGQRAGVTNAGSGGPAGETAIERSLLGVYLDEWLVPSSKISQYISTHLLSGGGGRGANGARNYNGNRGEGGGGGAGGSCGGKGGSGGSGSRSNNNNYGVQGGGGGGAGGVIVLVSESISSTLTVQTDGGNGGPGRLDYGGSGGGGGGGIILVFTSEPSLPDYNATGGISDSNNRVGSPGSEGIIEYIPLSKIK